MIKYFYKDLSSAKNAAQSLGITTRASYLKSYKQDPLLPSCPNTFYVSEWISWPSFLGIKYKYYLTISEAQKATELLNIKTCNEYRKYYKNDQRLPSNPSELYANEWLGWRVFLNFKSRHYLTLEEAKKATESLNITTKAQYEKNYKKDILLPASPKDKYYKQWESWKVFLGTSKEYYQSIEDAQKAACSLGIINRHEYKENCIQDPRLPTYPYRTYGGMWISWAVFLGTEKKFYSTLKEAQTATQALLIKTKNQYNKRYKKDSLLPSNPQEQYANEWKGWKIFLDNFKRNYLTVNEAKKATSLLSIKTKTEYFERYKQDCLLPRSPQIIYADQWESWPDFLGVENFFYSTLKDAQKAVKRMGIKTRDEYNKTYKQDPLLPANPHNYFLESWKGWQVFLESKCKYYHTINDAKKVAQTLGIMTKQEYLQRYKQDPKLPANPNRFYNHEWQGWGLFLGTKKNIYQSIKDAHESVSTLGIKTKKSYEKYYKKDSRLPFNPKHFYKHEWQSWKDFFGTEDKFYPSLAIAQQVVQALKIKNRIEYQKYYKKNEKLPAKPESTYESEWQSWAIFLGTKKNIYVTYDEAKKAVKLLIIKRRLEYSKRYKENLRLPANPKISYSAQWQGWDDFLGLENKVYLNIHDAQEAIKKLAIRTGTEYKKRYKEDSKLPSTPQRLYKDEWINWSSFLGKIEAYSTLKESKDAAKVLGLKRSSHYKKLYKNDPRLPANPKNFYRSEWQSWENFLEYPDKLYKTYFEAQKSAQNLLIATATEYQKSYKQDHLLPANPSIFYSEVWVSWEAFLLPEKIIDLSSLRVACKVLNIGNSKEYRVIQKKYNQLPVNPDKKFVNWIDWYDLLNISRPYSYERLREIVLNHKCLKTSDYKEMKAALNDPQIPSSPEETYRHSGWKNSYDFFGTTRPYQIKYFDKKWSKWAESIVSFLKLAKGGDTKIKDLCEFVREYIEPHEFETSPLEYLTRGKTNIQPMLDLFETVSVVRKRKWLFSINEFLNWNINNFLTLEDTETGEISRIKGARNPFSHINFDGEQAPTSLNETNKLALPYQFVKSAREWIFPPSTLQKKASYSDLQHLHKFSADWIIIDDLSRINRSDPDCVIKEVGGKTFLWLPIYWTYTYALMQLPARGRQIVYCDSGEADVELADIKNGKVVWERNKSKLAGLTQQKSMVSKTKDNDFGVYYTSNKTNFNGEGYSIPFMPLELAYWLIKLRKWQEKYNHITEPTKWLNCIRTNLNEMQRKQKGVNCFLFRDFQEQEPGIFTGRLTSRLAAALFYSSGDQLLSATYSGQQFKECNHLLEQLDSIALSPFKSEYTPHSMRVSLINAYAYEFGMPLEVIMKLVGHSSIVMSIYYIKSGKTGANIRERIQLGEKQALSKETDTLRSFIESQRIEHCKSQLIANTPGFLQTINNTRPASSYLFKDFGICPVGGAFCNDGGLPVAMKANLYHPVTAGYLGEQNCIQCRFFVTGPAFMMGLSALFNEVSLAINTQSHRYTKLEENLSETVTQIEILSHEIYQQKNKEDLPKLEKDKLNLQSIRRKLNSEIETRAKKMDLYMSDMNSINKYLINCQKVINQDKKQDSSKLQLIVPHEFEISFELTDVSAFQQLSEVCENAELYHSCSDELAVTRRSQVLDRMLIQNGLTPRFVFLTEDQQLAVGNQMTQLMLSRFKSWEKVNRLINGDICLNDFSEDERFSTTELKELFAKSTSLKLVD